MTRAQNSLLISAFLLGSVSSAFSQAWEEHSRRAEAMLNNQKLDSALVLGEQAVSLALNQPVPADTVVAALLHRLGVYHCRLGQYAPAESVYARALEIRERALSGDHPDIAATLADLGFVYIRTSRPERAGTLVLRSLAIREKVFGTPSQEVANTLGLLGLVVFYRGIPGSAEMKYRQALTMLEQTVGADHPDVATVLDNLAVFYYTQQKLTLAEETEFRALQIRERVLGPEANEVAETLNKLGLIHTDQQQYGRAEAELKRAIRIHEALFGPEYFRLSNPINNLGKLYVEQGRYEDAIEPYTHARRIALRRLGNRNIPYIIASCNLGSAYTATRRYDEAEELLQQTIKLASGPGAPDSSGLNNALRNMADLLTARGRFREADSLYRLMLERVDRPNSGNHADLSRTLLLYSQMLCAKRDFAGAWTRARRALLIRSKNFFEDSFGMAERERLHFASLVSSATTDALSAFYGLSGKTRQQKSDCAEIVFSSKGINTEVVASVATGSSDATAWLGEEKRKAAERLAKTYVQAVSTRDSITVQKLRDSLSSRIDALESLMSRKTSEFRIQKQTTRILPDSLSLHLPPRSTLVEYFRVSIDERPKPDSVISSMRYVAVVLSHNNPVDVIDLGLADPVDSLVLRMQSNMYKVASKPRLITDKQWAEYRDVSGQLCKLIWQPLAGRIASGNTVFVAPDGGLNLVSFAALIGADGKYLIENHPIHHLSAGRDLLRIGQDTTSSGVGLLALGDPDYNASVARRASHEKLFALASLMEPASNTRNLRSRCDVLSEMNVDRLPNTGSEVTTIEKYWPQSNVYIGASASEENFKHNAPGRKAIHLATHGFFLSGECEEKFGKKQRPFLVGENPLLQSGLLLAGANLHGSDIKNDEAEDGIVTALEVSAMDLRGVDLVVLSACETGLGKVEQGEGVYGLRRAFQMAGAKTVVSSLWQVPDKETAKFMRELYATMRDTSIKGSARLTTYPELMRKVALERIAELRDRGRPPHPYAWGGFVATGDWRIK